MYMYMHVYMHAYMHMYMHMYMHHIKYLVVKLPPGVIRVPHRDAVEEQLEAQITSRAPRNDLEPMENPLPSFGEEPSVHTERRPLPYTQRVGVADLKVGRTATKVCIARRGLAGDLYLQAVAREA